MKTMQTQKNASEKPLMVSGQEIWGVFKVHESGDTFSTPYVWCDREDYAETARGRFNHTVVRQVPAPHPPVLEAGETFNGIEQMSLFSQD